MSDTPEEARPSQTHEELESEKRLLECEKLRAEIAQLGFAWWKRPAYIGSLGPIALAVAAVISGIATGYFEDNRAALREQVLNLTERRDELALKNQELSSVNRDIQDKIDAAYIRLTLTHALADYGVSHMRGVPPLPKDVDTKLQPLFRHVSPEVRQLLEQLLSRRELAEQIIGWVEKDLKVLTEIITVLPTSNRQFEFEAMLDGVHTTDNQVYDYQDLREMRDDELLKLFRKE